MQATGRESKKQVYLAKGRAKRKKLTNALQHEDLQLEVFWFARQYARKNCDVLGEKRVHVNIGSLSVSDSAKRGMKVPL